MQTSRGRCFYFGPSIVAHRQVAEGGICNIAQSTATERVAGIFTDASGFFSVSFVSLGAVLKPRSDSNSRSATITSSSSLLVPAEDPNLPLGSVDFCGRHGYGSVFVTTGSFHGATEVTIQRRWGGDRVTGIMARIDESVRIIGAWDLNDLHKVSTLYTAGDRDPLRSIAFIFSRRGRDQFVRYVIINPPSRIKRLHFTWDDLQTVSFQVSFSILRSPKPPTPKVWYL